MRIWTLSRRASTSAAIAAFLLSLVSEHRVYAFGGFWSSAATPVRPSAEEILFVDNPDATMTALVRIEYKGPPQKFVWVIPLPGKPKVGVSSNTVFQRLDAATAPRYWVEVAVEGACAPQDAAPDTASGTTAAPSEQSIAPTPVTVVDHGSVGPYDYVNIKVDPTRGDPTKVATDWFRANGFDATGIDSALLRPYLNDGLHLLAIKLVTDTEVGAIRPVVLTYESKRPVIPIRPMAPSAREGVAVRVWVIGPTQAIATNAPSLVLNDARIDWLSVRTYAAGTLPAGGVGPFDPHYVSKPSNYDAVVSAAAREAGGQGFVTELGAPASQYRDKVWSSLDEQQFQRLANQTYADGIDAVVLASRYYRGWDGYDAAIRGATTLPAGVTIDEFGHNPIPYRGIAKVDAAKFFRLLEREAIRPVSDAAALLSNGPYLTRLYGQVTPDAMTVDPAFDYNADLALVSNVHIARQFIRCGPGHRVDDAPWRIELPRGGTMADKGRRGLPAAGGSMPANLKIVQLTTTGAGTVLKDNSDEIGMALFKGGSAMQSRQAIARAPQNGIMIGGTQTVTPKGPPGSTYENPRRSTGGSQCGVSHVSTSTDWSPARWLLPLGGLLPLRRRLAAARRRVGQGEPSS